MKLSSLNISEKLTTRTSSNFENNNKENEKNTWNPIKIGLTGSIGMGKSSVSKQFRFLGFPVFDADETVHKLYSKDGDAVPFIQELFPNAIVDGSVDRTKLSQYVLSDSTALSKLESIIHPLVAQERLKFLQNSQKNHNLIIVYDIPLLMKHPEKHNVDYIVVVTASAETQRKRVLSRPGMTNEKFASILSKQVPDEIQKQHAHYIINTDFPGYCEAKSQLAHIIEDIIHKNDEKWKNWIHFDRIPYFLSQKSINHTNNSNNLSINISSSVSLPSSTPLNSKFDLVLFDIDDLFLPTSHPLNDDAHHEQIKYLTSRVTDQTQIDVITEHLNNEINSIEANTSLITTNYAELRTEALYTVLKQYDEHHHVENAMELYTSINSQTLLSYYLYNDTIPCFEWFVKQQNLSIVLVSKYFNSKLITSDDTINYSNNNLTRNNSEFIYEFHSFITEIFNISQMGCRKLSILIFLTIIQQMNVSVSRILYIGKYNKDLDHILSQLQLHRCYIQREENNNQEIKEEISKHEQNYHIVELNSLNTNEISQKLYEKYFIS